MSIEQPTILIDFKKSRIRIHKTTLRALNNPNHVLLLVNPVERLIAVQSNDGTNACAHRVNLRVFSGKCFEIYSLALLNKLRLCGKWNEEQKYRIPGNLIDNQNLVQFRFSDSFEFNKGIVISEGVNP